MASSHINLTQRPPAKRVSPKDSTGLWGIVLIVLTAVRRHHPVWAAPFPRFEKVGWGPGRCGAIALCSLLYKWLSPSSSCPQTLLWWAVTWNCKPNTSFLPYTYFCQGIFFFNHSNRNKNRTASHWAWNALILTDRLTSEPRGPSCLHLPRDKWQLCSAAPSSMACFLLCGCFGFVRFCVWLFETFDPLALAVWSSWVLLPLQF